MSQHLCLRLHICTFDHGRTQQPGLACVSCPFFLTVPAQSLVQPEGSPSGLHLLLPSQSIPFSSAGYVVVLWAAGGYINTNAYVVAPQCVPSHLKASAAGLMAMTSQLSHTAGLLVAVVLAEVLFGGIAVV